MQPIPKTVIHVCGFEYSNCEHLAVPVKLESDLAVEPVNIFHNF